MKVSVQEMRQAAAALRAFLTTPTLPREAVAVDETQQAMDDLNDVVETLNHQLRERFGGLAAAIELVKGKKPSEGGRAILFWDGLFAVSGARGTRVLQPILNSPIAVRVALAKLLPDLLIQLEEE